ncbi:MAG TPA: polysaccharide deacetylase family protein [Polyangiaceae bacterium]|jgi:peptidoglycan/xylan/chitin deacetylase (PgdA/CDA1 family)|nr:polysaccharide deacetylase family protein [Polyangiaceae bacterium]
MGAIAEAKSALGVVQPELRARSRRSARALAEAVLPASMVVWRGPEGHRQPSKKPGRVALTFDDGPTPLTLDYLAVLERLGARATFFVVGELCAQNPELVAAIAEQGHELAGHGYTHRRFTQLSQAELSEELERTQALLPPTPQGRAFVRPPHGAVSLCSMVTCLRRGFTTVLWSFNSGDWCNKETSLVEGTFHERTAEAGEIVLLHEGQSWTMNALPTIVGALEKAGHELCTVRELLA